MIASLQNQKIKDAIKLRKRAQRDEKGLFIVEGARELELAMQAGFALATLFFYKDRLSRDADRILSNIKDRGNIFEINKPVFEKLAVREDSDGLVACVKYREFKLRDCRNSDLFFVVENIEKPGNLGALLRTADAFGVGGILLLSSVDIFNPNAIRASLGAVFTLPSVKLSNEELLAFCQEKKITLVGASPEADKAYYETDLARPLGLMLGEEARGLSPEAKRLCHEMVGIPMKGSVNSLNISVSGAIILSEALRQRTLIR
jgi:TrmH family RNA methyltransferase